MWNSDARHRQLKSLNRINPIGLKLTFKLDGYTARTEFTLDENHQGQPGYVHNGIIALLMDEGMGWVSRHAAGVSSVTGKLEVNFKNPAQIDEPLTMVSEITKNTSRLLEISVQVNRQDGTLIADGTCIQYIISTHDDAKGVT